MPAQQRPMGQQRMGMGMGMGNPPMQAMGATGISQMNMAVGQPMGMALMRGGGMAYAPPSKAVAAQRRPGDTQGMPDPFAF
mmetsp:Transcript_1601/g.4421  ORF Transcript_1601/g.4421 Transcript_1601/m.4421 type:complete len:81 (+) Transcript_1601:2-244(+)